ncbi:MAG: hypothetical protein EOL97_06680 [Spirochaetia bacterium]|jgi:hypothetical protein|nr:hypothetical protein [Spirochaetia bacterium]
MAQSTQVKNENANEGKGKKVIKKGGIYQVLRTTTYQGRTVLGGQKLKLRDPECKNRNLKKIGEFDIGVGFEEEVSGIMKDYKQEDDAILSSNANN